MQGSRPAEAGSKGKHTAKNIVALRGSERLIGWAKGEWIGKDASHRKETDRTNGKTRGKVEGGKAWQGQEARGQAKGVGVGVVMGVGIYVYVYYNGLLCAYMYIISVYMYIYTARGKIF